MVSAPLRILRTALALDAGIVHLHDPELIPIGLWLRRAGRVVVFDSHEDYPVQFRYKPYLPAWIGGVLGASMDRIQRFAFPRFDAIVAATPGIGDSLGGQCRRVVSVSNFPMLEEWSAEPPGAGSRRRAVCYVGGLAASRGALQMIRAIERCVSDVPLRMCGAFAPASLRHACEQEPGWRRVEYLGVVGRSGVAAALATSFAGLVVLHPQRNYRESQPIKLFEYMAAGVPVICSDFPAFRSIVETHRCGICVDPLDPIAIAAAIDRLAGDPAFAAELGENGRRAAERTFNWASEERKLLDLYAALGARAGRPLA
jgi:glycosyltransferase involved in cell wall biosynthesis